MGYHQKSKMSLKLITRRVTAIGSLSVLLVFFSGCGLLPKEEAVLAPPLKEPDKVSYDTESVKRGTVEKKVTGIGNFVSISQSDLYFKYRGGRIKTINIKAGDKVKVGDVIAELDTDNLESEIKQQEIAVKRAEATYNRLKSESDGGKEPTDITLARLQLNELERQYEKIQSASQTLPQGVNILDVFKGVDVDSLKNQISQKRVSLAKAEDTYRKDLENAAMSVESEGVKYRLLLNELEKSKLISPIAGDIVYLDTKIVQGEHVDAYKVIARVAEPGKLQLQYSDVNKIMDFRPGMKVEVRVASKTYKGEVVMTPSNVPVDADDTLKKSVRIQVDDLPSDTLVGSSGDISLVLEKRENVLVIPRNAVKYLSGRKYVQILEDKIKKERDIETGIETASDVEVIKGIKEGDQIIVR